MSLHSDIMNIQENQQTIRTEVGSPRDYKLGHRDARHAAAELSNFYDEYIYRLEQQVGPAYAAIIKRDTLRDLDELWRNA